MSDEDAETKGSWSRMKQVRHAAAARNVEHTRKVVSRYFKVCVCVFTILCLL
jgi:hypothetical protein